MKKIVCLVDYSRAYDNVIRYAAQLAHDTSSKLILSTLQPRQELHKMMAVVDGDDDFASDVSQLSETCDRVRGVWKVPCDYHEFVGDEKQVLDFLETDIELIVAGIESSLNETPEKLFSEVHLKIMKHSHVPVLLVPDYYQYHKFNRILYAFDYVHEEHPPVEKLGLLAEWLNTDVRVLSVVQKKYSPEEEEKIDLKHGEILTNWKSNQEISFDYIYYTDVTRCLEHYLELWKADDIIIFSLAHPSLTERLFHKSVIRQMTLSSNHPIMILQK